MSNTRKSLMCMVVSLTFAHVFVLGAQGVEDKDMRKENLVFGVVSDVHVRGEYPKYLEDAFAFFRDKGVDAVALCGDIANSGSSNELLRAGAAWDAIFPDDKAPDGRSVEKIFIFGNHDYYTKSSA